MQYIKTELGICTNKKYDDKSSERLSKSISIS